MRKPLVTGLIVGGILGLPSAAFANIAYHHYSSFPNSPRQMELIMNNAPDGSYWSGASGYIWYFLRAYSYPSARYIEIGVEEWFADTTPPPDHVKYFASWQDSSGTPWIQYSLQPVTNGETCNIEKMGTGQWRGNIYASGYSNLNFNTFTNGDNSLLVGQAVVETTGCLRTGANSSAAEASFSFAKYQKSDTTWTTWPTTGPTSNPNTCGSVTAGLSGNLHTNNYGYIEMY